ncbi:MAG: HupE/UreJ family protein [Casimicrobiaceae bacterium]
MKRVVVLFLGALLAVSAFAHKPSDAYLTLNRDGAALTGQWDIALRDLDLALGLDANGDGEITWGEVRTQHAAIAKYAMQRLAVSSGGERCALRVTSHQIDTHTDGAYAVVNLAGDCASAGPTLAIDYSLLHDLDPQHRGLLNFVEAGESHSVIFSADAPRQVVGGEAGGPLAQFSAYVREGVWHIWIGFDHILFLLSLLLPAVLVRRNGVWQAAPNFSMSFWDVFKIVTAFTVAHSITLTLAALGLITLPSRWIESAIAASVVLAALNNVFPVVYRGRWVVALFFGLVHGFGFAGALQDLGLPRGSLALSLAGFNVGVELGQLAIVAVFLPIAFVVRRTWAYRRVVLAGGSAVIAAIAAVWLTERAFNLVLFPTVASSSLGS